MNKNILRIAVSVFMVASCVVMPSCSAKADATSSNADDVSEHPQSKPGKPGGPQLGNPGGGPVIDKSSDSTLQSMIKEVLPKFKQYEFKDTDTGKTMMYNLYTPDTAGENTA